FVWPDAHPRHIHAEPDETELDGWRFWLIDVERAVYEPWNRAQHVAPLEKLLRRCLPHEPTRFEQIAFFAGQKRAMSSPVSMSSAGPTSLLAPHSRGIAIQAPEDARDHAGQLDRRGPGLWVNERDLATLDAAGLDSAEGLFRYVEGRALNK